MKTLTVKQPYGETLTLDVKTLSVMAEPTTSKQWSNFGSVKYTVVVTGSKHVSIIDKIRSFFKGDTK